VANNRDPQDCESSRGIVPEFVEFLRQNKRWWLLPLLILAVGLVALVLLRPTG
jgi:hypothetical protein